jgi:hypothetical protein
MSFFDPVKDILTSKNYQLNSEFVYIKDLGNNSFFKIVHNQDFDNELGFNIEFSMNNMPLLSAYCTDQTDFINVLNTFNV